MINCIIAFEQALQLWQVKQAARESASTPRTHVFFRVWLLRDFSQLPQMESLLAANCIIIIIT